MLSYGTIHFLQLNVSGCECEPEDCRQTTIAFQQLEQSLTTENCFADLNNPVNDVAKKILDDADYLRLIIEQLHNQNPKSQTVVEHSFNFKAIETNSKVENKWCNY